MSTHFVLSAILLALLVILGLTLTNCQPADNHEESSLIPAPDPAPAAPPPQRGAEAPAEPGTSSVLVYIKMVIEKEYGLVARRLGGREDSTSESIAYHIDNAWWDNPLVVHEEAPMEDADVIGRADAGVITGEGTSRNVAVKLTLVPHADVAVKTSPPCDAIKGTITATISTAAEFYDGGWTQMVREDGRALTFSFDTRDPLANMQEIGHETRTIPTFALERYTRDEQKWEPRGAWPAKPGSGDWRVVIYGTDVTMELTSYRYIEEGVAGAQR